MNDVEISAWHAVANDLGIEIVSPCEVDLGQLGILHATALVRNFGPKNGMVVDPAWSILKPFSNALLEAGYGFSRIKLGEYERARMIDVLRDWGWAGSRRTKPQWLKRQG